MESNAIPAVLAEIPFMHALPDSTRDDLIRVIKDVSTPETIEEGTVVFTQGEPGTDIGYFLLEGDIEIAKSGAIPLQKSGPELLGEMKQFNPVGLRTATVNALSSLDVLSFKWPELHSALEAYLSADAFQAVEQALENYAWEHFTEQ